MRRALAAPSTIGHMLFWYLQAEMHVPTVRERFGTMLELYLRACGRHRVALGHQKLVMRRLEKVALAVQRAKYHPNESMGAKKGVDCATISNNEVEDDEWDD